MSERWIERRRACWAYSPGGHLAELERATAGITFTDCFHITFAGGRSPAEGSFRLYHVTHPRRSPWRTLLAAYDTYRILRRERPALVLSTGADVALPAIVLGKLERFAESVPADERRSVDRRIAGIRERLETEPRLAREIGAWLAAR